MITPVEWYKEQRDSYKERYGAEWNHLSMFEPNQSSEICELAMRCGDWCRWLKPNGLDEIEMIANAVMIRNYIKSLRNKAYS